MLISVTNYTWIINCTAARLERMHLKKANRLQRKKLFCILSHVVHPTSASCWKVYLTVCVYRFLPYIRGSWSAVAFITDNARQWEILLSRCEERRRESEQRQRWRRTSVRWGTFRTRGCRGWPKVLQPKVATRRRTGVPWNISSTDIQGSSYTSLITTALVNSIVRRTCADHCSKRNSTFGASMSCKWSRAVGARTRGIARPGRSRRSSRWSRRIRKRNYRMMA